MVCPVILSIKLEFRDLEVTFASLSGFTWLPPPPSALAPRGSWSLLRDALGLQA